TGRDVDFFTDADPDPTYTYVDPVLNTNDQHGFGSFYALKVYTLDGSSGSKSQTPGAQLTISAIEQPISPDASSSIVFVPHDPTNPPSGLTDPQKFGINNPIGAVYAAPLGSLYSPFNIGVQSDFKTTRERVDAQVNGNGALGVPALWGGFTPHNKLSQTQTLTICDRSLLGVSGRKISQFRVERRDLEWNYPLTRDPINYIGLWEQMPVSRSTGLANTSDDYPDIPRGRLRCRMQGSGTDPSQGAVALRPTNATTIPVPPPDPPEWVVGANNSNVAVEVPKFQPPNMPQDVTNLTDLQQTGYVSTVYAYVDTNGNGIFDKPGGLGIYALIQQNVSGVKAEAYRVLDVQVHVPADYRAEIEEQRINVGSVPQGFGYTAVSGSGGMTKLFEPSLTLDLAFGRVAPTGFAEWYKPFTAKNTGNVNLMNVGLYRPLEPNGINGVWYWDLASDTVAAPERDLVAGYWSWRAGTGYVLPYWCVVSSLDSTGPLGLGFMTSPTWRPIAGLNTRTFHKARVDENEGPELKIPDFRVISGTPPDSRLPTFSIAVPLTQPVGTYYGRLQLAETPLRPLNSPPVPV
ncbi:MAG: hypothetical protein NTU88_14605, partial [Armatimonadetes bacterium]|nr:hypothetical protein [Armatimonadota bacterium]